MKLPSLRMVRCVLPDVSCKLLLLQGYFLASFLFMAIVFSLPICLGLAALALNLPVRSSHLFNFNSFLCLVLLC